MENGNSKENVCLVEQIYEINATINGPLSEINPENQHPQWKKPPSRPWAKPTSAGGGSFSKAARRDGRAGGTA